jgi:flagellar biosynthesis protein FlhG
VRYAERSFAVLVNMVRNDWEARRTFTQLARVAERFLHVDLRYVGHVPQDPEVAAAVRRQMPVAELAPGAPAARAFEALAERLTVERPAPQPKGGVQFFFRRLVGQPA